MTRRPRTPFRQTVETRRDRAGNAGKRRGLQADAWAISLAPVITEIVAQGYCGLIDLAHELEKRGCATRRGGKWSSGLVYTLCQRLVSLGILELPKMQGRYNPRTRSEITREGVDRGRRALRDNADDFARGMAPIVSSLRAHGYTSYALLADALNARGIAPQRAAYWTKGTVHILCERLREMAERKSDGVSNATDMLLK